MKESFKGFYDLPDDGLSEIWSADETLFILDTNILLNLYQYSQETQDEFFKALDAVKGKLWIPFHVALEYQRRRLEVIRNEKSVFATIHKKLDALKDRVGNDFSEFNLKARNTDLFDLEESFKKDLFSLVDNFKVEVSKADKSQPCVRTYDVIRAKLDGLLEGKVGVEPTEDWVLKVAEDGKKRYENKVPPGYEDTNKDKDASKASFTFNNVQYERKYGDLIIWKQMIEHLSQLTDIQNVIFITDDSKEDWWEIIDSRGEKKIGARPELRSEIYAEAGIENFKMYHTNDFLAAAEEYCGISVDEKAIEETQSLLNHWGLKNSIQDSVYNSDILDIYHKYLKELEMHDSDLSATKDYREALDEMKMHKSDLSATKNYHKYFKELEMHESDLRATKDYYKYLNELKMRESNLSATKDYHEALARLDNRKISINEKKHHKSELNAAAKLKKLLDDLNDIDK